MADPTPPALLPQAVSDIEMAWGGGLDRLLPTWDAIPEEYRRSSPATPMYNVFNQWFYRGLPKDVQFIAKDGISAEMAYRHILTIMKSYQPKHEHKTAACVFLMESWFVEVRLPPISS